MIDVLPSATRRALWRSAVTLLFTAEEVLDLPCLGRDLDDQAVSHGEVFTWLNYGSHHFMTGELKSQWQSYEKLLKLGFHFFFG